MDLSSKHFNTWKDEVYEVNARASNPVSLFLMFALGDNAGCITDNREL